MMVQLDAIGVRKYTQASFDRAQASFDRAQARFNAKSDTMETLLLKEPPVDPILLARFEELLKEVRQSRDDALKVRDDALKIRDDALQARDKAKQTLEDENKRIIDLQNKLDLLIQSKNEKTIEDCVASFLPKIRFPDPNYVVLHDFVLPDDHPHKSKFKVKCIPGEDDYPYMLAEDDSNESGQKRADALLSKSQESDTVVFAASGSGKTWLLNRVLKSNFGLFFVARERTDKNHGSFDLSRLADLLDAKFKTEQNINFVDRGKIVEFGVSCAVYARECIFQEWKKKYPNRITPEKWLLVQLHPNSFFFLDIFAALTETLFDNISVNSKFPDVSSFKFCAVDEAQMFLKQLEKSFESTQAKQEERRRSLRGFLSPVVAAIRNQTKLNVVMCGTGLSVIEATNTADSGDGKVPERFWNRVFSDFPPVLAKDVEVYLKRYLVIDELEDESFLEQAGIWLSGRRRFCASFVEFAVTNLHKTPTLKSALLEFISIMTKLSFWGKERAIADVLENFKLKAGVNEIKYLGGNGELVTVGEVWEMFNKASFLQCNGFDEKISQKAVPALVEIDLCVQKGLNLELIASDFEPLVLETCLRNFETQKDFLENWIRKGLDNSNSDKGKRWKHVVNTLSHLEEKNPY